MRYGSHKLRFLLTNNGEKILQEKIEAHIRTCDDERIEEQWRDIPFVVENNQYDPNCTYFEEDY